MVAFDEPGWRGFGPCNGCGGRAAMDPADRKEDGNGRSLHARCINVTPRAGTGYYSFSDSERMDHVFEQLGYERLPHRIWKQEVKPSEIGGCKVPFGLIASAVIGAGASIFGGIEGSSAAQTAAQEQADSAQKGLDFQKQVWEQEQQNQAPYLQAGQTSIANLMSAIQSGKFGAGSLPAVPNAPGTFNAPSLADAGAKSGLPVHQHSRGRKESSKARRQPGVRSRAEH